MGDPVRCDIVVGGCGDSHVLDTPPRLPLCHWPILPQFHRCRDRVGFGPAATYSLWTGIISSRNQKNIVTLECSAAQVPTESGVTVRTGFILFFIFSLLFRRRFNILIAQQKQFAHFQHRIRNIRICKHRKFELWSHTEFHVCKCKRFESYLSSFLQSQKSYTLDRQIDLLVTYVTYVLYFDLIQMKPCEFVFLFVCF